MPFTNNIAWDLTPEDTILGHPLLHEFKGSDAIPGLSFTETVHVVTLTIKESNGVVTFEIDVLGKVVWSHSFDGAGTHPVDLKLGSGSIKGTVTIS